MHGAGVSIGAPSFDWERRRRFQRFHAGIAGGYGQLSVGSSRTVDACNRVVLDTGVGNNKIAETCEHHHQDFLMYKTPGQDRAWKLTQIVEGYFVPDTLTLPANDSYISVGLGSPNSSPPFVWDENYMGLVRNLGLGTWQALFNNPWGSGLIVQDLGATAGGAAPLFATTFAYKVRVEYVPRVMIRWWLNDVLVHTYTDTTELQSFYDNAGTAADEMGAYFVSTAQAGQQTKAIFGPMYCETILT